MSQLTIYLDEESMREVKAAACRERVSVSKWARSKLTTAAGRSWPTDYFSLFGVLKDMDLERPNQGNFSSDSKRKRL